MVVNKHSIRKSNHGREGIGGWYMMNIKTGLYLLKNGTYDNHMHPDDLILNGWSMTKEEAIARCKPTNKIGGELYAG